jgi:threonine/homoserine/homoserine lactone efflux protein
VDLDTWLVFLPAAVLVAASPGANNFLALANGMRSGLLPAVAALAGRLAAFGLMILLVVVGLGAVLAASETAFAVIKWAGVAYLAWLGLRLWRSDDLPDEASAGATPSAELAAREFWVALANPKAVLLFTAFVPQFVDPARPLAAQFVPLSAAYIAVEFVAATGYAFAGSRIKALRLGRRGKRRVNRVTGGMMLAAAAWLATARQAG